MTGPAPASPRPRILILGIGNLLLGDEGVGVHATADDNPPGTVRELCPRFANEYPRTLSAHDIGLRDLVETAALTGAHPDVHLIIVSIRSLQNMSTELSPPVAAAIPDVIARVQRILGTIAQ